MARRSLSVRNAFDRQASARESKSVMGCISRMLLEVGRRAARRSLHLKDEWSETAKDNKTDKAETTSDERRASTIDSCKVQDSGHREECQHKRPNQLEESFES